MDTGGTEPRKENISAIFLLPALQIKSECKADFYRFGFINTYLYYDKCYYQFKPLYLLFNPARYDLDFYKFCLALEKSNSYIETIDIAGKVLFVFKIPERFSSDYNVFLTGKYSAFSQEFQLLFPMKSYISDRQGNLVKDSEGKYKTDPSMFYHIFNRTQTLREIYRSTLGDDIDLDDKDELYDKYNVKQETLNL